MPDVPHINTDMDSDLVDTDIPASPFPSMVTPEPPSSTTRRSRRMQDRPTSTTRQRMNTTRDYSHMLHPDLTSWQEGNGSVLTTTGNQNTGTTTRWTGRHMFRATTFSNVHEQPGGLPSVPEPLETEDAAPPQMLQLGLPDPVPQQRDPPSWLPQPRYEDSFRPTEAEQVIASWSATGTTTTESIYVVPSQSSVEAESEVHIIDMDGRIVRDDASPNLPGPVPIETDSDSQRTLQLGGHLLSFDTHIGSLNSVIAIDMLSPLVIDLYNRRHQK